MVPRILLFGFDLSAIAVSLWKLIFTDLWPTAPDVIKRLGLAILLTVSTVLVGLQHAGLILPPESEVIASIVLTSITVFLAAMGYGSEVASMVRAVADMVRLIPVGLWALHVQGDPDGMQRIVARYKLYK